jgi:hypothetical protein
MWRLVWFWCRKMSHTKKQRRSARQRGRREREEYLRAGPSILSRFLSIFNILMLWASQGTVGRDRGGRQTDRRVLFFDLFHQSVWLSSVVPRGSEPADGLTTNRPILFFFTYLSDRRASFREVPSQRTVDVLTTDRRIMFFFSYLSGRRASFRASCLRTG